MNKVKKHVKDWTQKNAELLRTFLLLAAAIVLLVYVAELVSQRNPITAFKTLITHPLQWFCAFFAMYTVAVLVYLITSRAWIGYAVSAGLSLSLAIASVQKAASTIDPVVPADLSMMFRVAKVTQMNPVSWVQWQEAFAILFALACVLALVVLLRKKCAPVVKARLFCGGAFLLLFALLFFCRAYVREPNSEIGNSYKTRGLVYSFIAELQVNSDADFQRFALDGAPYDEERVQEILAALPTSSPDEETMQPDIIVILSESFDDFTRYDKLQLSEDPMPFFHSLQEKYAGTNAISHTFGGGTANVEFEMLTGYARRFVNGSGMVYITYTKPFQTIASFLKSEGYGTMAIHPFDGGFYHRNVVLPRLGFDKFLAVEDMPDAEYNCEYVSDMYMTKKIIEELEASDKPQFIFGISMENHQGYMNKYPETEIKVLNDDLDDDVKNVLENYSTGLRHSDNALEYLITYIEERGRPTLLLFFGDHKPTIEGAQDFYQYAGVYADTHNTMTTEEKVNLLYVPYVMYKNYGENRTAELIPQSTNFIMNNLFTYGNIKKPTFFHYLDTIKDKVRSNTRNDLFIDSEGNLYSELPPHLAALDAEYRLMQYALGFAS